MDITIRFNYQEALENIYNDARWEAYYDPVIIAIFNMCCDGKGVKIVPVHETRKSGRKSLTPKTHFIETYSIVKNVVEDGTLIEKRYGIPDYVIVPLDSTYDNPQKSLLNIEFKLPNGLTTEYKEVKPIDHETELLHQFEYCDNIILTDGVTWYFLNKLNNKVNCTKSITLYDNANKSWKKGYREAYSDSEKEIFDTFNIIYDDKEKIECPPQEWNDLLKEIVSIIEKVSSKKNKNKESFSLIN